MKIGEDPTSTIIEGKFIRLFLPMYDFVLDRFLSITSNRDIIEGNKLTINHKNCNVCINDKWNMKLLTSYLMQSGYTLWNVAVTMETENENTANEIREFIYDDIRKYTMDKSKLEVKFMKNNIEFLYQSNTIDEWYAYITNCIFDDPRRIGIFDNMIDVTSETDPSKLYIIEQRKKLTEWKTWWDAGDVDFAPDLFEAFENALDKLSTLIDKNYKEEN